MVHVVVEKDPERNCETTTLTGKGGETFRMTVYYDEQTNEINRIANERKINGGEFQLFGPQSELAPDPDGTVIKQEIVRANGEKKELPPSKFIKNVKKEAQNRLARDKKIQAIQKAKGANSNGG